MEQLTQLHSWMTTISASPHISLNGLLQNLGAMVTSMGANLSLKRHCIYYYPYNTLHSAITHHTDNEEKAHRITVLGIHFSSTSYVNDQFHTFPDKMTTDIQALQHTITTGQTLGQMYSISILAWDPFCMLADIEANADKSTDYKSSAWESPTATAI
eukprot:15361638-Ditylum_brightwellii.AAC.1